MASTAQAPASNVKPLSFMEKLDPLVSVYCSKAPKPSSAANHPRLIIIGSWTGAKDVHISKYIIKYQALYPAAQILLLKSTTAQIIQPAQIGPAVKHAVPVIRSAFPTKTASSSPELLIHIFSNGGCSNLANLYEQYAMAAGPGEDKKLPPHITIFDSCPSYYSISHAVAFVSTGMSSFQQLISAPLLYTMATIWSAGIALGLLPDSLGDWGKAQNDHEGNKAELRRVYIYSDADALIDDAVVEAHAADAVKKGFSVKLEKYEGSAHVAHLRKDEARYWDIVTKFLAGEL